MAGSANRKRVYSPQPMPAAGESTSNPPQTTPQLAYRTRARSPERQLAADERTSTPPRQAYKPNAGSEEILREPIETSRKGSGELAENRKLFSDQWSAGGLYKYKKTLGDDEDNIVGQKDGGLIIAGFNAEDRLLGSHVAAWDESVLEKSAKRLAKEEQACGEYSVKDHYELLRANPEVGEISPGLWFKARDAGDHLRRAEADLATPSASDHIFAATPKYADPASVKLMVAEPSINDKTGETAPKQRPERPMPEGKMAKAKDERGLATTFGDMKFKQGGRAVSGQDDRKRKFSEDGEEDEEECGEEEGQEVKFQVESSKTKKPRTEGDFVSHIEVGSASMYTEAESKSNGRVGAWSVQARKS